MLQHVLAGTTDQAASDRQFDGAVYTDVHRGSLERDRLFRQYPQVVAFSAELPDRGSWLPLTVCGLPILLTRDEHGAVHAFLNACAHRAAELVAEAGAGRVLTCPFHGWSYTLDGSLRGIPGTEHFTVDKSTVSLPPLPVLEWGGLLMVSLVAGEELLAADEVVGELGSELQAVEMDRHTVLERRTVAVDADWKLVTELSLESYHFNVLHRDSVAAMLRDSAVVDTFTRASRWAFPLRTIGRLADLDDSEWPAELQGSCTYTLMPGVMLVVNASGVQMIRAEPAAAPGRCQVSYIGVASPGLDIDEARAAYQFGGEVFFKEDLPAAESMQRALAAGAPGVRFGRNEPLLQFWHDLWEAALR
jgi:phenylpropionate dioxygenase-like ring-hydroxylating dioxygenase large terminal subunit